MFDGFDPEHPIVDIGCGTGSMSAGAASVGLVIGIDAELGPLRAARSNGLVVSCGDAASLPLRTASVRNVLALEVMEHVEVVDDFVLELRRVLAPRGRAVVSVPTGYTEKAYRRLNPAYWPTTTHRRVFSRRVFLSALEDNGLSVERHFVAGLDWAVKWLLHSVARTKFDFTGTLHGHHGVNRAVDGVLRLLRRLPAARRGVLAAEHRLGKSFYAIVRHR